MKQWRISGGMEHTNLAYLTEEIHAGRSYSERWQHAFRLVENRRGNEIVPFVHLAGLIIAFGLGNPLGRIAILGFLLPFYFPWALFFSYESRTLAIAIPFMGLGIACGLATVAGLVGRAERLAAARVGGKIGRLLLSTAAWMSILIVLVGPPALSVLESSPDAFFERLSRNAWGTTVTREWTWPFIAAAASVGLLAFCRRRLPFRLNVPVHVTLAACVLSLYSLQATVLDSATLIARQKRARRLVGIPFLNRELYEYAERTPFKGKIATNYFHLEYLPDIGAHYAGKLFPIPISADYLESLQAQPDIRYILVHGSHLSPGSTELILANAWPTLFNVGGWTLIRVPDPSGHPR